MLKAYSVFNDLDKKACEIIRNAGVQLDISNSSKRPDKKELMKLFNDYDILIIGVKERFTKDMLEGLKDKKIIATLSVGLDHIDNEFFNTDYIKIINCPNSNVISVAEHIFSLILSLKKRIIESNDIAIKGGNKKENDTFNVGLDIDVENYKSILSKKRNNVIVTPHIAGVTQEAIERIDVELAYNINEYLKTNISV